MITKKRSTNPILRWIQNEDNMNMLYGLGAASCNPRCVI